MYEPFKKLTFFIGTFNSAKELRATPIKHTGDLLAVVKTRGGGAAEYKYDCSTKKWIKLPLLEKKSQVEDITKKELEAFFDQKERQHTEFKFQEAEAKVLHAQFISTLQLFLGKRFMKRVGWFNASINYSKDDKNKEYGIWIKFYGIGNKKHHKKIKKIILKNLNTFAFLIEENAFSFGDDEGFKNNYSIKKDGSNLKIWGRSSL